MSRYSDLVVKDIEGVIPPIRHAGYRVRPIPPIPSVAVDPSANQPESDLSMFLRVFRKRWRIFLAFAALVMVLTGIVTLFTTPMYRPEVRIEIGPPGSEAFSINRDELSASDNDYVETQVLNLSNEPLAIGVIREMRLDKVPELSASHWYSRVLGMLTAHRTGPKGAASTTVPRLTGPEARALGRFNKRLVVRRVGNSRVVSVGFASEDPVLAAEISNRLASKYVDEYYRARHDSIMQSSQWIELQLEDIRAKMQASNHNLADFQRTSGIADLDAQQNTFTQQLADLNRQLTQAEIERIQYESYLIKLRFGNEDALPQVAESQVVIALKQKLAQAQADLARGLAIYGPNHSKAKQLENAVENLSASLTAEKQRIVAALTTNFGAAEERRKMLDQRLKKMSTQMDKLAASTLLKKESETNSEVYNKLYTSVKEASIAAASKSSNINVIGKARVLDGPTSPNIILNFAIGMFLALSGGAVLAFAREGLDQAIYTPEELKKLTGYWPLSVVPVRKPVEHDWLRLAKTVHLLVGRGNQNDDRDLAFVISDPRSPEAEAVRSLKSSILCTAEDASGCVILVVSSIAGEGKTLLSVNLASALGHRDSTCLVDADLRRPKVAKVLDESAQKGIIDILNGQCAVKDAYHRISRVPHLTMLGPGRLSSAMDEIPSPESLAAIIPDVRKNFRFVVVDCPPLIPYPETRVMSKIADAVILLGRCGVTPRAALVRSMEMLRAADAPLLGVVLNGVDFDLPDYRYYKPEGYSK